MQADPVKLGDFAARYTAAWCSQDPTMTALPDMRVVMDDLRVQGDRAEYHWTLTGTNTGPEGTGNRVRITGFELWQIGPDGFIASSQGHFDSSEYHRQLGRGGREPQ